MPCRSFISVVSATRQPPPTGPMRIAVGDAHVGEEHLVEVRRAGELADRPHLHARRLHVEDEVGQPRMLRHIRIAARDQDAEVAVVRAGVPDLLAVDHPVVAVAFGAGAQRGEVGPAGRFREQLAPHLVGAHRRPDEAVALLRRAADADRRHGELDADAEDAGQHVELRFLLVVDHVLDLRAAATAPFLRPVDADEARIGLLALERLGAVHRTWRVLAAAIAFHRARLAAFGIGFQEGAGLGAECGFFRGVFEVHRLNLPASACRRLQLNPSAARSCCSCAVRRSAGASTRACRRAPAHAAWRGGSRTGSPSAR